MTVVRVRAFALVAGLAVAACSPSAREIRTAKESSYQTDFSIVWNTVSELMHARFHIISQEDAISGVILSGWKFVERASADDIGGNDDVSPNAKVQGNGVATAQRRPGILFRMVVHVKGGPPWTVFVDGEAAEFKPDLVDLIPFPHGAADEPNWVYGKIDAMYVEIYRRLKPYAVVVKKAERLPKRKEYDTTRWSEMPAAAGEVIADVHDNAKQRDAQAIKPRMTADFEWSPGAPGSEEQALALWAADSTLLTGLAATLEKGCTYDQVHEEILCPKGANADSPTLARFRRIEGQWKFVTYYQGAP